MKPLHQLCTRMHERNKHWKKIFQNGNSDYLVLCCGITDDEKPKQNFFPHEKKFFKRSAVITVYKLTEVLCILEIGLKRTEIVTK